MCCLIESQSAHWFYSDVTHTDRAFESAAALRWVGVFQEAHRVLRKDGRFWLNIGDSYVGAISQHKLGGSQGKTSRYSQKHMEETLTTGRKQRNKTLYEMGLPTNRGRDYLWG
jgi:hypothetical protein